MMCISIILPTYQPKEYLWQCLTAVEQQTLDHKLFEVLLVLNGPREPYEQQILAFLSEHPSLPCRLLYNEVAGVSAARNRGLDEAQGEYICFIDDDDIITPSYLQSLYELATSDTTPLSYITIFDDGTDLQRPCYITQNYRQDNKKISYKKARRYFYVPYCKMLHRDIIGSRRFDTALRNGEDALYMFLISDRLQWIQFTSVSAAYQYRQRPTSAFNAHRPASYHIANMLACQSKASRIYFSHPLRYSFTFYLKYVLATFMGCLRHIFPSLNSCS